MFNVLNKVIIKKIIYSLLLLLVFLTPLIFGANTFETFEFPKTMFFCGVGATVIWLTLLLGKKIDLKKADLADKLVLLFVGAYLTSTVSSSHLCTSVWGYYTRFYGGLVSILISVGIYFVVKYLLNKELKLRLLKISCLTLLPVSLFAVFQALNLERVYSTFGQPNWLAAYIAMLAPVVLHFLLSEKKKVHWILLFLVSFATLWLTYSVSGLLGFGVGILVFTFLNKDKVKKNFSVLGIILSACILFAALTPGIFKERLNDTIYEIKNTFIAHASETYQASDSGFIRKYLWKGTVNLFVSSPKNILVGAGPETFPYEFPSFRPSELNDSSEWNVVFNKPHNYYLELLSNTGLLGLLSYLLLVFFTLKKGNKYLAPAIVGLLVTNIFGWTTVSTGLLFWMFLGMIEND